VAHLKCAPDSLLRGEKERGAGGQKRKPKNRLQIFQTKTREKRTKRGTKAEGDFYIGHEDNDPPLGRKTVQRRGTLTKKIAEEEARKRGIYKLSFMSTDKLKIKTDPPTTYGKRKILSFGKRRGKKKKLKRVCGGGGRKDGKKAKYSEWEFRLS